MSLSFAEFEVIKRVLYDHGLIDSYFIANYRDVEELKRRFEAEDMCILTDEATGLRYHMSDAQIKEMAETSLLFPNKGEK